MSIKDTLQFDGLNMLRQVLQKGGLFILTNLLNFQAVKTSTGSLNVTLESLNRFFKLFKKAEKSKSLEVFEVHG